MPPEEQAESLIEDVEQLVTYKNLKAGQGKFLIKKLEGVIKNIDQGTTAGSCDKLQSFIDQVNGLVKSGKLTPSEGTILIDAATVIQTSLGC